MRALALLILLCIASGCDARNVRADLRSELLVVDGAYGIRADSASEVSYSTREHYPAIATLNAISSHLTKAGWHVIEESFLNPGIKNSTAVVDGWGAAHLPGDVLRYQWTGQWIGFEGRIVVYTLTFTTPYGRTRLSEMEPLSVHVVSLSSESVAQMKALAASSDRQYR